MLKAVEIAIRWHKIPLPHNATWGNTQNHAHKLSVLFKVILEHISISVVAWIDIQHILPWCPAPFGWHRDELEDKRLDAACCFESEPLHVKPRHDEFIEVAYDRRKQKKHRIFSHEGFWKPVPAERFFKRAQRTKLFGLCRAQETKVALPIRYSCHRRCARFAHLFSPWHNSSKLGSAHLA